MEKQAIVEYTTLNELFGRVLSDEAQQKFMELVNKDQRMFNMEATVVFGFRTEYEFFTEEEIFELGQVIADVYWDLYEWENAIGFRAPQAHGLETQS